MEKLSRMPQVYGYLVCLVAVVTVLICASSLMYAILDLGDPLHSGFIPAGAPSLASFENYKMDVLKSSPKEGESARAAYLPDDQTLRAMYDAAKEDKIQRVRHESNRTIVVDTILLVICVVLFAMHWKWMKRLSRVEA